jgi:hypothetical protein
MARNMKWTSDFKLITLDTAVYNRVLLNALRNINERAGQAWINTVVNKTPIPTWSGASRATFQKLANELGTSVPIGPIKARKSRVQLGQSTSTGSGVFEKWSGGGPEEVGFIYQTSLRYLAYNEYNRATKGSPPQPFSNNIRFTPYNFQVRAQAAWQKEAAKAKLPNPYKYLKQRSI